MLRWSVTERRKHEPLPSPTSAGEPPKGPVVSTSENKAVVERFGEIVDGGDPNELEVLCTPDFMNHALPPGGAPGVEGTREFLSSPGRRAHAGRWVERVVVAERDYIIEYGVRAGNWPAGSFRRERRPDESDRGDG